MSKQNDVTLIKTYNAKNSLEKGQTYNYNRFKLYRLNTHIIIIICEMFIFHWFKYNYNMNVASYIYYLIRYMICVTLIMPSLDVITLNMFLLSIIFLALTDCKILHLLLA